MFNVVTCWTHNGSHKLIGSRLKTIITLTQLDVAFKSLPQKSGGGMTKANSNSDNGRNHFFLGADRLALWTPLDDSPHSFNWIRQYNFVNYFAFGNFLVDVPSCDLRPEGSFEAVTGKRFFSTSIHFLSSHGTVKEATNKCLLTFDHQGLQENELQQYQLFFCVDQLKWRATNWNYWTL